MYTVEIILFAMKFVQLSLKRDLGITLNTKLNK